ncbi:MAG: YhcH/YjgK/YiaL family protein [Haloferula sp.]
MAIFGAVEALRDQWPQGGRWEAAHGLVSRYLTDGSEERLGAFSRKEGESVKIEISDGIFLIEEAYRTKEPAEVRWEAHREWADVQLILAGEERMDVAKTASLKLEEDLSPQRDMLYFGDFDGGSRLCFEAGDVAIFLPSDGHRPGLHVGFSEFVRKVVIKVRL